MFVHIESKLVRFIFCFCLFNSSLFDLIFFSQQLDTSLFTVLDSCLEMNAQSPLKKFKLGFFYIYIYIYNFFTIDSLRILNAFLGILGDF